MLWRHARDPVELDPAKQKRMRPWPAFMMGLATQLANPKVIVFFGSIFVALLPAHSPIWVYVVAVIIVFCNEIGWYAIVAMLFSVQKSRNAYISAKTWIDRAMGGFLGLIGARLIVDA
jgi:threonine/homoserine/homoserine lactone efflux protein